MYESTARFLIARKRKAPKEEIGYWKKQELHKEKRRDGGLSYVVRKNSIEKMFMIPMIPKL